MYQTHSRCMRLQMWNSTTAIIELKNAIKSEDHINIFSLSNKLYASEKASSTTNVPLWRYSKCKCVASIELGNLKYLLKCSDSECEFERAYALYRLSRLSECFKIVEHHDNRHSSEGMSLLLAQCYYKDEQFTKSMQHFNSLYKSFSESTELESLIAVNYLASLYRTSRLSSSTMVNDMISSHSSSYDIWHNMALIHLNQNDISNAKNCMERSLKLFEERLDSKLQLQFIEYTLSSTKDTHISIFQYWVDLLKQKHKDLSISSMLILANNIIVIYTNLYIVNGQHPNGTIVAGVNMALNTLEHFRAFIMPSNIKSSQLTRSQIIDILVNASMLYIIIHDPKRLHIANEYTKYVSKISDPMNADPRISILFLLEFDGNEKALNYQDVGNNDYKHVLSYQLLLTHKMLNRGQAEKVQSEWSNLAAKMVRYNESRGNTDMSDFIVLIRECVSLMVNIDEDKVIDELLNPIIDHSDYKSIISCYCLALKGKILQEKGSIERKLEAIECYKNAITRYPQNTNEMNIILIYTLYHLNILTSTIADLVSYSSVSSTCEWSRDQAISFGMLNLVKVATSDKESTVAMTVDALLKNNHISTGVKARKKGHRDRMKQLIEKYGTKRDLPAKKNWSRSSEHNLRKNRRIQRKKKTGTQGIVSTLSMQQS